MILAASYFRFPAQPRLVDDLHVFEMPEGLGFQLRGGVSPIILRGRYAADSFRALRPLLGGRCSLEELISGCPREVPVSALLKTLVILHTKGLLTGPGILRAEDCDPSLRRQLLFWGRNLGSLQRCGSAAEVQHRIEQTNLVVVGAGLLAAGTIDILCRSGMRSIRVIAWDDDGFLAEALSHVPTPVEVVPLATTAIGPLLDQLRGRVEETDLLLAATLHSPPSLFHAINRFCLRHRIPWLPGNLEGDVLELGPFASPGETACYNCMRMRQASVAGVSVEDSLYQAEIEVPHEAGRTPPRGESLAFTGLASSLIATEVLRIVTSIAPPTLANAVRRVSLLGGHMSHNPLMPVPVCTDCLSRNGRTR